jgi:hydroxypyruvate isomerase
MLSAHIGYLYGEHGLLERVGAAARDGFTAVEHPNPLSVDASAMREQLQAKGLVFSQMGAAGGDASKGEKGLAALPGREVEFRDALRRSLDYAEVIGCPFVHPMAGVSADDPERVKETYLANLSYAVSECRSRSTLVLIEAISEAAVPGYFMSTLEKAVAFADAVAPSEISLLVDTFHAAANGTDLAAFIPAHADRIGHVHIADFPGRHEPGTGGLDFVPILQSLIAAGYRHAIGFEYIPSGPTRDTFGWMPSFQALLGG